MLLVWVVGIAFLLYALYILFGFSYNDFTLGLLKKYNKLDKIILFQERYFTILTFQITRFFVVLSLLFWLISVYFLGFLSQLLQKFISYIGQYFIKIAQIYQSFLQIEKLIFCSFFVTIFFINLKDVLLFPLMIDEVFNYVFLSSKGLLVSATYYPGPNNHVFYTLCVAFLDKFLNQTELILRLPSFISSLFLLLILFTWQYAKYGFVIAFSTVQILAFLPAFRFYSFQGRGYMLTALCALTSLFWVEKYLIRPNETTLESKILFVFINFLSFYTIPTYLYFSVSLFTFGLIWAKKSLKKQWIITYFFIAICTIIAYLPIIFLNGLNSLVANSWVKPLSWNEFLGQIPNYLVEFSNFLWLDNQGAYFLILLFIISTFYLYKEYFTSKKLQEYAFFLLLITIFLVPLPLIFLQKVLPFVRIWLYLQPVLILILLFLIHHFLAENTRKITLGGIIMWIFISNFTEIFKFHRPLEWQIISQKIITQKPQKIFVNEDTYNVFLRYQALKQGQNVTFLCEKIDTSLHYDYIILEKKRLKTIAQSIQNYLKRNYFVSEQNQDVQIYLPMNTKADQK
ncbi:MAG: hypothetical protein NZ551_06570 [Microscillaceae bacterium]|nr:hypothetical protein [Microscillaceae bacterium]MDW8460857.1 hypothetical protein [Cytophagales bacterium]